MVIVLKAKKSSLHLETVNELNWCKVHLLDEEKIFLGADNFPRFKERIINYLKGKDINEIQNYNGLPVIFVVTLSETHTTWYGTLLSKNEDLKIFIQDAKAHFFSAIQLDKNDIKNWIDELEKV